MQWRSHDQRIGSSEGHMQLITGKTGQRVLQTPCSEDSDVSDFPVHVGAHSVLAWTGSSTSRTHTVCL